MSKEAIKLALKGMKSFQNRTNGLYEGEFEEEIKALEEALKQEQGEPVAWIEHHKGGDNLVWDNLSGKCSPLYTAPPRRKPLTDDQVEKIMKDNMSIKMSFSGIKQAFEAAYGIKE